MAFKDNLLKKIKIDQLADQVLQSLGAPADSPRRLDREAMQTLLTMGTFKHRHERDLDLYFLPQDQNKEEILVLDNELKIYRTTVEDIVLRKSPTIKEMVSIRNAIKILNDKDVVTSAKADSLHRFQKALIDTIDLHYSESDLDELVRDGCAALDNSYADGVIEAIDLFAVLLGWRIPPKAFQVSHHHIRAEVKSPGQEKQRIGPLVFYSLSYNRLGMLNNAIGSADKAALNHWQQQIRGEIQADLEGNQVLEKLKAAALKNPPDFSRKEGRL
jgi:hypothetical protein